MIGSKTNPEYFTGGRNCKFIHVSVNPKGCEACFWQELWILTQSKNTVNGEYPIFGK